MNINIYVKQVLIFILGFFLFSFSSQRPPRLSKRQVMLEKYINTNLEAIQMAPDSISRAKIISRIRSKHILFIQDSLKFSTYPIFVTDSFYFEKAFLKKTIKSNRTNILVTLENKKYSAIINYDVTNEVNITRIPTFYSMLSSIKQGKPVIAIINLQDLYFRRATNSNEINKFILLITIRSIYNTNQY